MKYQAETDAVYDGLMNISEELNDNIDRFQDHQLAEIQDRINHIKYLLKKRFPLKAKRELKQLDIYIYNCNYNPYHYFDDLQREYGFEY